jgi:hypothetical protein
MAGDIDLRQLPKDVQCPFCDAGVPVKKQVTVPITIWGSEEVQYASFDAELYAKIEAYAKSGLRHMLIQQAQRRFRVNRSLVQARARARRSSWM